MLFYWINNLEIFGTKMCYGLYNNTKGLHTSWNNIFSIYLFKILHCYLIKGFIYDTQVLTVYIAMFIQILNL